MHYDMSNSGRHTYNCRIIPCFMGGNIIYKIYYRLTSNVSPAQNPKHKCSPYRLAVAFVQSYKPGVKLKMKI